MQLLTIRLLRLIEKMLACFLQQDNLSLRAHHDIEIKRSCIHFVPLVGNSWTPAVDTTHLAGLLQDYITLAACPVTVPPPIKR